MMSVDQLNRLLDPIFPGLMGVKIVEATPEKIVATMAALGGETKIV